MKNALIGRSALAAITLLGFLFGAANASGGVSVAFNVTSAWATGLNGELVITNNGPGAVSGWTLEFDFPGTITNSWNGTVTSHVGAHYIVHDAGYNAGIAVNGNVAFGFTADPASAAQPPANFVFNGGAIGGGTNPQITTASLPGAGVGVAYSQALSASGGTAPYLWSVTAGVLPTGLTLSSAGVISGTRSAGVRPRSPGHSPMPPHASAAGATFTPPKSSNSRAALAIR